MTRPCLALLLGVVALGTLACSDAETPKAFDAGPLDGGGLADGGTDRGNRDQPCVDGRCNSNTLVCVREGDGAENCRLRCERTDPDDPCGPGSTCVALQGDEGGACLPAGGVDEPCPCDEGFACTQLDGADGGIVTRCKTTCDPGAPADAGPECPPPEQCRPLANSTIGVCVD